MKARIKNPSKILNRRPITHTSGLYDSNYLIVIEIIPYARTRLN